MDKNKFSTLEAAQYLDISAVTLEGWRNQKKGPAYCKPMGKVYYLKEDLDKWLESGRVDTSKE